MGPKQLAGVMEIVARNAAAGRGIEVDEEALLAQTAALEGTDRARVDGAVLDGPAVGRRDHPPGRLANGDGDRAVRGAQQRGRRAPPSTACGGTDGHHRPTSRPIIRLLIANRGEIAVRIARTAASPRHRHRRRVLRARRQRPARRLGRRRRRARRLDADRVVPARRRDHRGGARERVPTRSIPATGSSPRTPSSRRR